MDTGRPQKPTENKETKSSTAAISIATGASLTKSVASTISQEFIKKLQDATSNEAFPKKFWEDYSSHAGKPTFQDVLNKYAEYYEDLSFKQKEDVSKIFWELVKAEGTPIIEDHLGSDLECDVYFLFRKDKLSDINEQKPGIKKDLYLQGDFHGMGSTDGRQKLLEFADTGIMCRSDRMPRESIIVYKYIEAEPWFRNIKPIPELPPFFSKDEGLVSASNNEVDFPAIIKMELNDEYCKHTSPFPDYDGPKRILPESADKVFRVSADSKQAHIPGKPIDWPSLLTKEMPSSSKHFVYYDTLYSSNKADDLLPHPINISVTKKYHDDLNFSNDPKSPYVDFTRSIQVFTPVSGKIDNLIVINDGIPYLLSGILDHFEKMAKEEKLSPNTAFVFVNTLPGLEKTLSPEAAADFKKDPSASAPGMGVRSIEYKHGIDQYIDFIATKLFPYLKKEGISVPDDDPSHRMLIGSSLSGTASIYIGYQRPDLFGAVIAQSPSPDNRVILSKIPKDKLTTRNIHLSCGAFEHPDYAAANANVEYAKELESKLGIPLHIGAHGHQFVAWAQELNDHYLLCLKQVTH